MKAFLITRASARYALIFLALLGFVVQAETAGLPL